MAFFVSAVLLRPFSGPHQLFISPKGEYTGSRRRKPTESEGVTNSPKSALKGPHNGTIACLGRG